MINPLIQTKTPAEHRESMHDAALLDFWFVWHWLHSHPHETVRGVLRCRVDLLRKTDIYPGKWRNDSTPRNYDDLRWLQIESDLTVLYHKTCDDISSDRFEQESLACIHPLIDARVPRDLADGLIMDGFQCGSLKCDPPKTDRPGRVHFHIANALEPHSMFADQNYLPKCLLQLADYAEEHFSAREIATITWLNQLPKWQELFPYQWQHNTGPLNEDVDSSLGHWGQFRNSRGLFNHKLGQQMRVTGRMPYLPCESWCRLEDLRAHLMGHVG